MCVCCFQQASDCTKMNLAELSTIRRTPQKRCAGAFITTNPRFPDFCLRKQTAYITFRRIMSNFYIAQILHTESLILATHMVPPEMHAKADSFCRSNYLLQSPSMKDLYDSKTTTLQIPLRVFASIVTFSGMTKFCSDAGNLLD